jgi:hypothetical protein
MTTLQSIESKDLTVGELLSSFYLVPSYQREYVWQREQVEQLLTDVLHEHASGTETSEYFIGSLVVLPREESQFELIDGQQRVTTLYLILCAVRDHLVEVEGAAPGVLKSQISATTMSGAGDEVHRYRIELQYEDSGDVIQAIGGGSDVDSLASSTRSIGNILTAYRTARAFLRAEFKDDPKGVRRYYAFLINQVKLIRVRTSSMAHALKVFETINDRGVGLDSMDLLKNLLFMRASTDQFEKLNKTWKALVDILHGAGEKPLRFLRYFILSGYNAERLREEEIYTWFSANPDAVGYERDPLAFAEHLLSAAQAYTRFAQGQNADGTVNRHLDELRRVSGTARQHLILLMAARGASREVFNALARHVENLFFVYIITREATKSLEREFAIWAAEVRDLRGVEDVARFVEARFTPIKKNLAPRFRQAFETLRESDLQRYRVTYVLAKLSQFVDEIAKGSSAATALDKYIRSGVEIEHILPQRPDTEMRGAFDLTDRYDEYVGRLGNLTLLEKPINSSVSNGRFELKRPGYASSDFLLTRSLAGSTNVGLNTSYTRATAHLMVFDSWTSAEIERRQAMLTRIAHRVWDVPDQELGEYPG